jgi:uncharacterized protein (DUF2267 family)
MSEQDVFEATVATSRSWLHELMRKLDLQPGDAGRALHALRAGLHAIRDRLPAAEVVHLGAQLPVLVRGVYYDGWRLFQDPTRMKNRNDLVERVRRELGPDPMPASAVLQAVIDLVHHHVSQGEIDNLVATLPKALAVMWKEEQS